MKNTNDNQNVETMTDEIACREYGFAPGFNPRKKSPSEREPDKNKMIDAIDRIIVKYNMNQVERHPLWDSIFGKGQERLYLKCVTSNPEPPSIKRMVKKVAPHLKDVDTNKGIATDQYGRKVKLAKALKDKVSKQWIDKLSAHISKNNASVDNLMVVLSCNLRDIIAMSTGRKWTSCTDLAKGKDTHEDLITRAVDNHCIIAYLIDKDDLDIKNPISRVLLSLAVDNNGNKFYFLDDTTVYGDNKQAFLDTISAWVCANIPAKAKFCTINDNVKVSYTSKLIDDKIPNSILREISISTVWGDNLYSLRGKKASKKTVKKIKKDFYELIFKRIKNDDIKGLKLASSPPAEINSLCREIDVPYYYWLSISEAIALKAYYSNSESNKAFEVFLPKKEDFFDIMKMPWINSQAKKIIQRYIWENGDDEHKAFMIKNGFYSVNLMGHQEIIKFLTKMLGWNQKD